MEVYVSWLVLLAGIYLAIGFLFSLAFIFFGVGKIDPVAKQATWCFRVMILPGMTALWPIFALRLIKGSATPPIEKNAHRSTARAREGPAS